MKRKTLLWLLPVAVLTAVGGTVLASMMQVPDDLDYSLSHVSDAGLYQVTLEPGVSPVPVGSMHGWTVAVTDKAGALVEAELVFDGGMPQHGHGLPTVPQIVGRDDVGRYVVGGVRFNMPGWWELKVHVDGPAGDDTATFNIAL